MSIKRKDGWQLIEIDQEIFSYLQQQARPFLDTPNDVLRRLLLPGGTVMPSMTYAAPVKTSNERNADETNSQMFVERILKRHFDDNFQRIGQYQFMFESDTRLVYFQNYNKEANKLWFRLNRGARQRLEGSSKEAWLCLTYPPGRYAYIIPAKEMEKKAKQFGSGSGSMEISIYPTPHTNETSWRELDWNMEAYRHEF